MGVYILKVGPVIKELRRNKKLTAIYLYKDILSRTASVRFEKGLSDTSTEKFFIMLERLNITLEEFHFSLRKNENTDFHFFEQLKNSFYNQDHQGLYELKQQLNINYQKTKNIKFYHYYIIVGNILNELTKQPNDENQMKIIRDYLIDCESWGYYELVLFSNTINFYSEEIIDVVFKRAKNQFITYGKIRRYKNELAFLIMNILEILIRGNNLNSARLYYKELIDLQSSNIDIMYITIMIKYFGELIKLMENKHKQCCYNSIEKMIDIFDYLDLHGKKNQCLLLYKYVKEQK